MRIIITLRPEYMFDIFKIIEHCNDNVIRIFLTFYMLYLIRVFPWSQCLEPFGIAADLFLEPSIRDSTPRSLLIFFLPVYALETLIACILASDPDDVNALTLSAQGMISTSLFASFTRASLGSCHQSCLMQLRFDCRSKDRHAAEPRILGPNAFR